jgi:hypothetical protein
LLTLAWPARSGAVVRMLDWGSCPACTEKSIVYIALAKKSFRLRSQNFSSGHGYNFSFLCEIENVPFLFQKNMVQVTAEEKVSFLI